jgi:hypothetical protein
VLRIRDMLVRIRIRGSVPLTNVSGCDPDRAILSVTFKMITKNKKIFVSVFCLFPVLFEATFTSFYKDNKS